MELSNSKLEMKEKAELNLENIKQSIQGLYQILDINLSGDDFYFKLAQENLLGLYQNIIELILNEHGLTDLVKKIKNSKVNLDISLDDLLVEK